MKKYRFRDFNEGEAIMNQKNSIQDETARLHFKTINRDMIIGWMIIVVALLATYTVEFIKDGITLTYLLAIVPIAVIPLLIAVIIYCKKPDWQRLCYYIVPGYFVMYLFVMITGKTSMVFTYILPMLSLLTLYHHPKLILCTGIAALLINIVSIIVRYNSGLLDITNSKDAEIQIALILLCFGGCYFASRLYDSITKKNYEYLKTVDEKNERIQALSLQTLTTMANMIDAKDSYTEGHSRRVSTYAVQLAEAMGFSPEEVENIRKIALLHDIGKIGVPDGILNKPGRLTDEEFNIMKGHSSIGGDIIKNIKTVPGLHDSVLYHHERYDGKGYPAGLKGEDIPYIARIIAVADAFDAMTSDRVYRTRLSNDQVLSELEKGSGSQFDPDISHKMLDLIHEGTIKVSDLPS
ncbi:MAG: HD-GYP domain-containing protein [Clostridiales bacterium]|nr:HD-GYP domain-containing protein [Clostridiales bacterium]